MDYKALFEDLSKSGDLAKLSATLSELADQLDVMYTETAPNGAISARIGRIAIYKNGATYEQWMNVDGATTWQRTDVGAAIVYAAKGANSDITSLSGLTTPLSTAQGGTGAVANANAASGVVVLNASSQLPAVSGALLTAMPIGITGIEAFTSSGTWTKPAGVSKVWVKCWGGGGGAGGNSQSGGGGGGGYAEGFIVVTGNVTVTVGDGGTDEGDTTGGASSFAVSTTITANGGSKGAITSGGAGGAGGTATGGSINMTGIAGGTGTTTGAYGGNPFGGVITPSTGVNPCNTGIFPGGGASGHINGDGTGAHGAAGLVIVYW